MSGRKGPGILQPWRNIILLFRKGSVISPVTGTIFRLAPVIWIAVIICGIFLIPFPGSEPFISFSGDFVMLAYLLALGKMFFILAALDTGSSFEGMGAAREALYSMLAEPAFFIIMGTLALVTGHTSMQDIFSSFGMYDNSNIITGIIGAYLLMQIALVENSRMPVDDPKTHLELTMIHEVMILDHSGFDLALIQTGTIMKFSLYGLLISNILIPAAAALWLRIVLFLVVMATFAIATGLIESFRARKKMNRNPQFILTLSSIALLAFVLSLLIINRGL